ncbi:DUF4838 domain-containing protein [uncultured Chryseobacterium sp.]|uniref:DUF4838 domain-containing protein n=1 Tax=uncultured Chryseobacterium sp. TaxID=259322 RepID=UPI002606C592|nr:DUF4838 domain-containing protein [uncultured Chryseobacterium sp.]
MKKLLFLILFIAQLSFAKNVNLVQNGKTDFQIVIPLKKTESEWNAAFLLKKYIDLMAGVAIPVVYDNEATRKNEILVGKTNRSTFINTYSLQPDAIVIRSNNGKIYITGGERKGVLYATSTFLEDFLKIKKFTKDFEVIPFSKNISVPSTINIAHTPPFIYRTTYFEDSENLNYADWHKLNYFFEERRNFAHSFNQYLPDSLFKTHPEYFALVDGKRTPVQPCLSNPDVYKIMKTNLIKEMVKYPNFEVWSISATDDGTYCHCNLCEPKNKAGNGFIETLMPFVNKFAKDFPNKTISTLAYRQSIEPSKFVKPLPNVEIMLCYTHINRGVPIATGPENAVFFRNITSKWKAQTNNIFVWDYVINYLNTLSPFPNLQVLQPNVQYLRDQNIKSVFLQGSGAQKSEFNELKCYLIAKLLWNPDINIQQVQNEFIDAYYGAGAPEIKQYIAAMQTEVKKHNAIVDIWADPKLNKNDFLSDANIAKYRQILNRALDKTKNNPTIYNRILKEKLSVDYAEIQTSSDQLKAKFGKKATKTVTDFTEAATKAGIIYLKNGEQSPIQYKEKLLSK